MNSLIRGLLRDLAGPGREPGPVQRMKRVVDEKTEVENGEGVGVW